MALKDISKFANEEFVRQSGVRFFEVPVRQLFSFSDPVGTGRNATRELIVHPDADLNRRVIATLALEFQGCNGGVSLRRSLQLGPDGKSSLLYAAGAKLLCAIEANGRSSPRPRMVAFALVMGLKAEVLEAPVLRALTANSARLPTKALYLELVCALPHTGGATYLLLRLLAKLDRANTGILAHCINARSRNLMERHQYSRPTSRNDVYYLSREEATRNRDVYLGMLRLFHDTEMLCWRRGASPRTADKTYWDCR